MKEWNWISISHYTQKSTQNWLKTNERPETVKLLVENIRGNLYDVDLDNDFMEMTPKTQVTKWRVSRTVPD